MTNKDKVLVANGQGFWGDSILGPIRLVNEGPLDFLTLDYLAEVTMSIMQKLKRRDPGAGYATDFVKMVKRVLPKCREKGIKIVANAGGVNPAACRAAVAKVIGELGMRGVRVGVVEGDDILDDLPKLIQSGEMLNNMDSGERLEDYLPKVQSANVYIGAGPIVEALDQGADIVITGRATDPSVVVAPIVHHFGWAWTDFDKLAAATIAGHIVECGAQCTGGNFIDWRACRTWRGSVIRLSKPTPMGRLSSRNTPERVGSLRSSRSPRSWCTKWGIRHSTSRPM